MASRQMIYDALIEHAKGHIAKHSANVEVYMEKAVGVGEHPDILEAVSYTHLTLPTICSV